MVIICIHVIRMKCSYAGSSDACTPNHYMHRRYYGRDKVGGCPPLRVLTPPIHLKYWLVTPHITCLFGVYMVVCNNIIIYNRRSHSCKYADKIFCTKIFNIIIIYFYQLTNHEPILLLYHHLYHKRFV
jgi:hypothetical protein